MNEKKQLLVQVALQLFYRYGINSVGINEVLATAGIAKKTLYHHFRSKEELVLAALQYRDKIFIRWLESQLADKKNDQELITALFESLTLWFNNEVPQLAPFRGCFFINTAAECGDNKTELAVYCALHKQRVRELIQQKLLCDDPAVLDMVCLLKEGAIVTAYVGKDPAAAVKCLPLALEILQNKISKP